MGCGASKPEESPQEAGATAPPPAVAVPVIDDSTSALKVAGTTSKEPVASAVPSAPPMSPSFAAAPAAPLAVVHAPPPGSPLQIRPPAPLGSSAAQLEGSSRYEELRRRRAGIINQARRLTGDLLLFGQAMPVIGHVCEGLREILTSVENHQEQADYVFEAAEKMNTYLTSLELMAKNVKTYEFGNQEIVETRKKHLNNLLQNYLGALNVFEEDGQLKRAWNKRGHVEALTKLDKEITECLEHLDRDYGLVRDADHGRRVRDQGDDIRQIKRELGSFRRDFLKIDEVKLEAASTKLKLNASNAAFFKTGVALLKCNISAAIEVFRAAVDKDEEMSHAWLLLCIAFERERGSCQDALDASYKSIKFMPSSSSTEYRSFCYLTLDILLYNLRNTYDLPEETYRKAIKLNQGDADPRLFLTHFGLGQLLHEKRDLSGAEYHLRKGIEIESTQEKTGVILADTDATLGEVRYNLGVILLNRDDCAAAAKEFREAAKLKPENAEYRRMNDLMPSMLLMGEQKDKGWSFDSVGRWGPPEKP